MKTPTVHINGTSQKDLLAQLQTVYRACAVAQQALAAATPNGRDYYPQGPEALRQALAAHQARCQAIAAVQADMVALATELQSHASAA